MRDAEEQGARKRGPDPPHRQGASQSEASSSSFTDWDNPEDRDEDQPEGYDDDEDDDGSYVPGPDDPDYDLSEQAGYAGWDAPKRNGLLPQWVIVLASLLLILAMVTPLLIRFS
jgi:hypothetical protein